MPARLSAALLLIAALVLESTGVWAETRAVPGSYPTVQGAVDDAADGDVIEIAPGVYAGNVRIRGKSLTLRATDPGQATVLEGVPVLDDGGTPEDPSDDTLVPVAVVEVRAMQSTGTPTEVELVGLTVQGGDSGVNVRPNAHIVLEDCHVRGNDDGVELEGRGETTHALARATVRRCLIEENGDDGVDVDQRAELWLEDSTVRNNVQDGIEIRLQDNQFEPGEQIRNVILRNRLEGNGEDGLQLIDYYTVTPRAFRVERNVISGNGMAGLGMMCEERTVETFEACPIPERVELVHNTFLDNDHGVAGGANVIAVSNLFDGHALAVKNVVGDSQLAHTLFHDNAADHVGSDASLVVGTTVLGDPQLDAALVPAPEGAAVDAGVAEFELGGETILEISPCDYRGERPDLGAFERDTGPPLRHTQGLLLANASEGALEKSGKLRASVKRLDLGSTKNNVLAGLRFEAIGIPPGAEILGARLALTSAKKGIKPASLRIRGEENSDAAPFGPAPQHLSGRDFTESFADWGVDPWLTAGASYLSPDLSALVTEIIEHPDWAEGNALALFASGTGKRSVVAFEGPAGPPRLVVDFVTSAPMCENDAP
jgi:hypothetical protein